MDVGYQSHDLLPLPRAIAASSPPSFSSASASASTSTSTSATCAAAAAAASPASPASSFSSFPSRSRFLHFLRRQVCVNFADAILGSRLFRLIDYRASYPEIQRNEGHVPRISVFLFIVINLFSLLTCSFSRHIFFVRASLSSPCFSSES